jgi:hypothetical protein
MDKASFKCLFTSRNQKWLKEHPLASMIFPAIIKLYFSIQFPIDFLCSMAFHGFWGLSQPRCMVSQPRIFWALHIAELRSAAARSGAWPWDVGRQFPKKNDD